MTKPTKILLTGSLISFALGFTNILWGIGTPIGAILFGLFLLSKILEKETALFNEEHRARLGVAQGARPANGKPGSVPERRSFALTQLQNPPKVAFVALRQTSHRSRILQSKA